MTKSYYRSEYSDKQWKALIDKATELGCQITYSKYGNIVTIDSKRNSRPFITMFSKRLYIDRFIRNNSKF